MTAPDAGAVARGLSEKARTALLGICPDFEEGDLFRIEEHPAPYTELVRADLLGRQVSDIGTNYYLTGLGIEVANHLRETGRG